MELVIVMTVVAILASAFSAVMVPQMNVFFYYPQSSRVNNAAADLLDIIIEGDSKTASGLISGATDRVRGLRFTNPACYVPNSGTGGDSITAASASSLTYQFNDYDSCGPNSTGRVSHTVVISYDSANHIVTRTVDGGTAIAIPYYAVVGSDIKFDPPSGTNFFRYYGSAGTELSSSPTVTSIYRVDITVIATSGSGQVKHNAGQILLKSGVEIKRYVA